MDNAFTIRTATVDDAPGISRVLVDGWRAAYRGILPGAFLASFSYEQHEAGARQHLAGLPHSAVVFVAERDSADIVGVALVRCGASPGGLSGELEAIYVRPSLQRGGVGSGLFQAVVRWLKARGSQSLSLWVLRDNPYRRFYDRAGGELLADEKQDDFGGGPVTSVSYGWRDLDALDAALNDILNTRAT